MSTKNKHNIFASRVETVNNIKLTKREIDIISCLANSQKTKQIAEILRISTHTAENHIKNIMVKFGCTSRVDAFNLINQSEDINIIEKHYFNLLIKAIFERHLLEIADLVNKPVRCLIKYDLLDIDKATLLEENLQTLGLITEKEEDTKGWDEYVKKPKKTNNSYLIYFVPDNITIGEVNKLANNADTIAQNIIFIINTGSGFDKNDIKFNNFILVDFNDPKNYCINFLGILKLLVPQIDSNKLSAEYEGLIYDQGNKVNDVIQKLPYEAADYIGRIKINLARVFSNRNKILLPVLIVSLGLLAGFLLNSYYVTYLFKKKPDILTITPNKETTKFTKNSLNDEEGILLLNYIPFEPINAFTARTEEIQQINQKLEEYGVAVIHAFPGTGKTTLAAEYGHRQQNLGLIIRWVDSDSGHKILSGCLQLAKELGISEYSDGPLNPNDKNTQKPKLIRNLMVKIGLLPKNILFIFDNVEHYEDIKDLIVNLPPNVKVLITTRLQNLCDNWEYNIRLEPFSDLEAGQYLQKALVSRNITEKEINEFVRVYRTRGGLLPLKLARAVNIINTSNRLTIDEYISNVRNYDKDDVETYILLEVLEKSPLSWQVLQYAVYLDPDFIPFEIFDELLGQKLPEADIEYLKSQLLTEVVYQGEYPGFRIHRLIQESLKKYIKRHPKNTINEQKIISKLLAAMAKLFPLADYMPHKNWQQANLLYPHIMLLLKHEKYLSHELLYDLYYKLGRYSTRVLCTFKNSFMYYEKALEIIEKLYPGNNNLKKALLFNNIGLTYTDFGEINKAIEYYNKALSIIKNIHHDNNHPEEASTLNYLGNAYNGLGNAQQALYYHEQALSLRKKIYGDIHVYVAGSLNNIGIAYRDLGLPLKALKSYYDGLEIIKRLNLGDHAYTVELLNNIGVAHSILKDGIKALEYHKKASGMAEKIYKGNSPHISILLNNIGDDYLVLKQYQEALNYYNQALKTNRELYANAKGQGEIATSLNSIGNAYLGLNDISKALYFHHYALKVRKESYFNDHPYIAYTLDDLANDYLLLGDNPKATEYHKQAYMMRLKTVGDVHPYTIKSKQKLTTTDLINLDQRKFIDYHGHTTEATVKVYQKIQSSVLQKIQSLASEDNKNFWSHVVLFNYDLGIKGYISEHFLKRKLGILDSPKNIEIAKTLCFEAINLGIFMHGEAGNLSYPVEFVKLYPETIQKIIEEHPEYFIDKTILTMVCSTISCNSGDLIW